MKKKLSLIALLAMFVLLITGCGTKEVKTTDDFTALAESKDMEVVDVYQQFASAGIIKEATVARNDDWQVEFYVLTDDASAEGMYETNVGIFESRKGSSSSHSSVDMENYSSYALTSDGSYMYVIRVDNTVLYLDVEEEFKEDVQEFVEELGY